MNKPPNQEILMLIRQKRKAKGISQKEVANILGVSQSAYKDIELGKTDLKVHVFFKILDFLGIDVWNSKIDTSEYSYVHNVKAENENLKREVAELRHLVSDLSTQIKKQVA